ncbi:hypothetical protein Leryth_018643 [Lithospermum erythrorhizon]|nr:hypothetical protein Leryth_018643 [Lithospermum erythrorhizon]
MKIILVFIISIFLLNLSIIRVNGQISTPCTSSTITTFTPCFNFITGSSSGSSSPTKNCCNSIKSFVSNNKDCACLIVTGNVPISIPFISQNLAISLPRMCNGGVPIQSIGAPLPPPGPALFAPPPSAIAPSVEAPRDSTSPAPESKATRASKASTLAPAPPPKDDISPAASPLELLPPSSTHPRIKPVLNPKSASSPSHYMFSPSILIIVALIVLKC